MVQKNYATKKPSEDEIRARVLKVVASYDKVTADKVQFQTIFIKISLFFFSLKIFLGMSSLAINTIANK